ncbi:37-kD nucleoid-associated bacterial protein [Alistipes sp. cv1]|nr:37-kD nucleoid-associated bacterial protein [Faecalibacterium prausnitzii]
MVINNYDIQLESLAIHWIGNKTNDDGTLLSKSPTTLSDDISAVLLKYFLSSFKLDESYRFTHNSDLELNEVYNYASKIFENPHFLHEGSVLLAKFLYELSLHPNIKPGELYVAYFTNCEINDCITDAIGIFKSENKETFLEVHPENNVFSLTSELGININKLDKGCLIYNVNKENGYVLSVIDNTNRGQDAKYWIDDFLHIEQCQDEYYNTHNLMNICKNYVVKQLPKEFDITKADQAEFLNKSAQYFKQNEEFNLDEFTCEVIAQPQIIDSFKTYKQAYEEDHEIEISDEFSISSSAVKKQSRSFKSVIKLDKNFHIYVHGNNQYIKRGYDEDTGMYYYQLFFKEEL